MSWLSLTTGHYLCTSRGVQHVTASSKPVLIRAKKGEKRKCLQGPCARPPHQPLPEPGDSISGETQALSSPTSSPSHTYSVSTCGPQPLTQPLKFLNLQKFFGFIFHMSHVIGGRIRYGKKEYHRLFGSVFLPFLIHKEIQFTRACIE